MRHARQIYLILLSFLGAGLVLWIAGTGQTRITQALPDPPLNPLRGIHAPIGYHWTDTDRDTLQGFADPDGFKRGPGSIIALSADMLAANNKAGINLENDLKRFQNQGTEVYIRLYPQRFPGGLTESAQTDRNTVSGEPADAVEDILNYLKGQQQRQGWHFTHLVPGNEPNLEWPNSLYYQNLLPWNSNDDPLKFNYINRFFLQLYQTWEAKLNDPALAVFRDVKLYFPAIAQDGATVNYGGSFFYDGGVAVENKYDRLRPAISLYPGFSWHNYWRPGYAWEDRVIANFPGWLKEALLSGQIAGAITESGWTPEYLRPDLSPDQQKLYQLWRGPPWSYLGPIPATQPDQDSQISGVNFEDEVKYFIEQCSGAAYDKPAPAHTVMVWLAASGGGFGESVGIDQQGKVRRWFQSYAAWKI